jgi:hypothetical protein
MPGDSVIMASWFDDHWYKVTKNGKDHFIASVTTILDVEAKPFLARWRGDIGNREAEFRIYEARMKGKRIHHALHAYLLGGIVLYNPWENPIYSNTEIEEMKQSVNGVIEVLRDQDEMLHVWKLQRFFEIVNPRVIGSEKTVYSIEKDIAGTLDIAMEVEAGTYPVNGSKGLIIPRTGIYIADLKTGGTVTDGVFRQIAPYAYAYEEMELGKPEGALVLHTGSSVRSGIPGFAVKICMREDLPSYLEDYFHLAAIWKRNNPHSGPEVFQFPSKIQRRAA